MIPPDAFLIRAAVPDFHCFAARYAQASEAVRANHAHRADVSYGEGPRERIDLIFPLRRDGPAPVHVFVHGGYWRAGSKADHAFVAAPVLRAGGIAAIVEYDLMPGRRMAGLVRQVRQAFAWIARHAPSFGGNPLRLTASGHSAGAHLASYLAARGRRDREEPGSLSGPVPQALLLVSGIYDLRPVRHSFLQPELSLTQAEAIDWSPLRATPDPACARTLVYGGDETVVFADQCEQFARALALDGGTPSVCAYTGLHHMDILLALGDPNHPLGVALADMVQGKPASPAPVP